MRRAARDRAVPGIEVTKIQWQARTERIQQKIGRFHNAAEGSIESAYRDQLIDSLQDGPP
jgi:hypothetical protein